MDRAQRWKVVRTIFEVILFVIIPLGIMSVPLFEPMTLQTSAPIGMLISLRFSWPVMPLYLWSLLSYFYPSFYADDSPISIVLRRGGLLTGAGLSILAVIVLLGVEPFIAVPFIFGSIGYIILKALWYFFSIGKRWSQAFDLKESLALIGAFVGLPILLIAFFSERQEFLEISTVVGAILLLLTLFTIPGHYFLKSITKYFGLLTKEAPFAMIKGISHVRTHSLVLLAVDTLIVVLILFLFTYCCLFLSEDIYNTLTPYESFTLD